MKLKFIAMLLLAAAIPFDGYPKTVLVGGKYNLTGISAGSSKTASALKKRTFSYGEITLEPDDSLVFALDDMVDTIGSYTVLDSFLPAGIEITWTGTKFKVPKAGRVKYSKSEGDFVTTREENPCGFKISISSKGKVRGSFKVYAANGTKLKSYTATFSGNLEGDGLSVKVKKANVYSSASIN